MQLEHRGQLAYSTCCNLNSWVAFFAQTHDHHLVEWHVSVSLASCKTVVQEIEVEVGTASSVSSMYDTIFRKFQPLRLCVQITLQFSLTHISTMWYASLLCILLNAPLAVAFYGKCTQAVNSLFISSFGATYIDVGTIVTVFTPTSSNRVLLTATLTAYFTSIQYLQCTIFRDGVNLVPDALQGVDATFTTETTPLSMTYLDSPPASATYTYSVRCRGEGYVSFNGNPRQLSAVLLAGTYTNSAKVNNNPATITATNFVTMGLDTTANVANQENLLVLATTNFYPSVDGDGNNFARYTILRSSFNLAIGGVHPLLYTSSLLRNKRRSETMIFMDSPAPASNIPYSVGVSKGGAGTFTTGTVAETGTIAVIAVPIARSGVFTTTGNTLVTVNAWVNLGFSVTVVPTVTTDKVLVTGKSTRVLCKFRGFGMLCTFYSHLFIPMCCLPCLRQQ